MVMKSYCNIKDPNQMGDKHYERKVFGSWMLVVSLPQAGQVLSEGMVLPSEIWTHMVQWDPALGRSGQQSDQWVSANQRLDYSDIWWAEWSVNVSQSEAGSQWHMMTNPYPRIVPGLGITLSNLSPKNKVMFCFMYRAISFLFILTLSSLNPVQSSLVTFSIDDDCRI